jgi:proteasome accessory factor C
MKWECSALTVHRTIAHAREKGFSISPRKGCYQLEVDESIEIPGFRFAPEELAALLGLSHWLEVLGSGVLKERLGPIHTRLEAMLQKRNLDPAEWKERIRLLPMHFRPVDPDVLLGASRAVLQGKAVGFEYKGVRDSKFRLRKVSPQTLVRYRDNWYVDAWDGDESKLRSFALSRMRGFYLLQEAAQQIPRPRLDAHFAEAYGIFAGRARRTAKMVFSGEAARFIAEEHWHPNQRMSFLNGGRLRLEFPCGDVRELARDVMRYADEVEVIGPEELREAVAAMVRRATASKIGGKGK